MAQLLVDTEGRGEVARCKEHWILEQQEGPVDGPCCQAEQLLMAVCHVLALCDAAAEKLQEKLEGCKGRKV